MQSSEDIFSVDGPSMLSSMDDFIFNHFQEKGRTEMGNIGHYDTIQYSKAAHFNETL